MADAPPVLQTWPRWSHGGIPFPVERWHHRGGQRYATHERPKVPGSRMEKNGRRAHIFTASVLFDESFNAGADVIYPDLYPTNARALLAKWDNGETMPLVVPGRGTFQCFAATYDASFDAKILSGERVEVEFHEDVLDVQFGVSNIGSTVVLLATALQTLLRAAASEDVNPITWQRLAEDSVPSTPIIDAIASTINNILAIKDQVELYDQLFASRIELLLGLCQKLERSTELMDCRNSATLAALMDVWATAQSMQEDLFAQKTPLRRYEVPRLMTIDEASNAIYGDATHTTDILTLNAIDDPYAIPPGRTLTYYEEAT